MKPSVITVFAPDGSQFVVSPTEVSLEGDGAIWASMLHKDWDELVLKVEAAKTAHLITHI